MRNIFITIILLSIFSTMQSQDISYEKLDSISSAISQYQLKSENLTYNDGRNDYELGFPENNFRIFSSTKTATKVVNKKINDKEFVCITEDIDLSKVNDVFQVQYPGSAGVIRINFPEGVNTQIYTDGVFTDKVREYYLEFFYNRDEKGSRNLLLDQLENTFISLGFGKKIPKEQFLLEEKIESSKPKLLAEKKVLTVDDVIEKYVLSLGGADKIRSIQTVYSEGVIQIQGMQIPVRNWFLQNQAMRMDMEIQGKANTTVVTRNSAWTLFPMQNQKKPVDTDPVFAKESSEELDVTGDLFDYQLKGSTVELIGKESVDGNDFYKIKLIRKSGTVVMLFLDANTFFLTKRVIKKNMQGTIIEVTETIGNYKINDEGFVYASSYQYSPAGTSLIYNNFQVNKNIDQSLFARP